LAMVVTGAPVAAQVCETTCATQTSTAERSPNRSGPSHHQHPAGAADSASHHGHAAPAGQPAAALQRLAPDARACVHQSALASESREDVRGPLPPLAISPSHALPPLIHAVEVRQLDRQHGPPDVVRSTAPLRI
jgi:hypothetical protein